MSAPGDSFGKSAALNFIRSPGFERMDIDRTRNLMWIWQTLDPGEPVHTCQPWEADKFGTAALGSSNPVFQESGTSGNRQLFWIMGAWEGCVKEQPPADEIFADFFRDMPGCPIVFTPGNGGGSVDINSRVGISGISTLTDVAVNSVEDISEPDAPAVYLFDRILDIRGSHIQLPNVGLGFGYVNFRATAQHPADLNNPAAGNHLGKSWFNLNWGADFEPMNLFLPGLPDGVPLNLKMALNGGFLGSYSSDDLTPFYIYDNEVPKKFSPPPP